MGLQGVATVASALVCGPCLAAAPASALAGDSPTGASTVGELIVTATKRDSTVQKTPISVTAVTGRDLQSRGVTSAQDIVQSIPGIAVASAGPGQAVYEIRGLSADGGESPTIGFYLDETPVTPPVGATTGKSDIDPDLYDLSRVEVLRGPQGTLYGAGSMGGTVKLVTNPPDFRGFHGSAESIVSGTEGGSLNYAEKAMLNAPIIDDKLALRVVATYGHDSGWIDRIVVPNFPLESNPTSALFGTTRGPVAGVPGSQVYKGVNDDTTTSLRASLLIKPTDRLSITPSIFYQKINQGGMNAYDSDPGTYAHYEPFNIPEPFSDGFTVYSLTGNYDFDAFSVTSATGYWTRRSTQVQDATELTQNAFQFPAYTTAGGGIGPAMAFEIDSTHQFTQEIRLASRGDDPFKWLVGAYYSAYSYTFNGGETAPGFLQLPGPPFPTDLVFHDYVPATLDQTAVFANVSYTIAQKITLTAGARYFSYRSKSGGYNQGIVFTGSDATNPLSTNASASGVTPMFNLSYSPTRDLMVYASASKGFREGAGNFPVPTTGPVGSVCLMDLEAFGRTSAPLSYNPDSVWTYEIGEKDRLFQGRVIVDGDLYYTKWSKVQQPVSLACGIGFTDNGADAEVKGGELEVTAKLTESLSLIQNVGYAYGAFSTNFPESGIVKGQPLLDAPRWTVSTTLQYVRPVADNLKLIAGISNSFVSSSQDLTYGLNTIPARDITNARLGLDFGRWSAYLFADNLFNQRKPIEYLNLLSFTGPPYNRIATNRPFTAGLDLSVDF